MTGRATELGHGLAMIRLPLPFPRLRWVNCYVLESDEGLTLIDCGVDTAESRHGLSAGLGELGFALGDVTRLIGTHLHVDHVGMAGWVADETAAAFVMHESAAAGLSDYDDWTLGQERMVEIAAVHGAPDADLEEMRRREPRPEWAPPGRRPTVEVADGDAIPLGGGRLLTVVHTPGHDAAHICLVDSRTGVMFSGDHVLPRITPVVLHDPDGSDRLGTYLESLRRIELLEIGLTYPAHGTEIRQGSLRARQITLHHERRLGAIDQELRHGPATAWQIMEAIFRPQLLVFERRLAFSETLAHLEHLGARGEIVRFEEHGVLWFRRTTREERESR